MDIYERIAIDIEQSIQGMEAARELRKQRKVNPWVRDIIRALWHHRFGLTIDQLEAEVRRIRDRSLPEPRKYRETLQSTLNQHTSQSNIFRSSGKTPDEDLFYSPRGKGSGTWAVRKDVALLWLQNRGLL